VDVIGEKVYKDGERIITQFQFLADLIGEYQSVLRPITLMRKRKILIQG